MQVHALLMHPGAGWRAALSFLSMSLANNDQGSRA
jgi:hypothetical protein